MIYDTYGDVIIAGERLYNLYLYAPASEGGLFIVPHLLWPGAFFLESSEGLSYFNRVLRQAHGT